jgi:DNA-binding MarR family transcriptional regulator
MRICDSLRQDLSALVARHGLSLPAFYALGEVERAFEKGCPMHHLGGRLTVSRANVTGLTDSLEQKGLVRRSVDKADRRVKLIQLTTAGRRILAVAGAEYDERLSVLLGGVRDRDKELLTQKLIELAHAIERAKS